MELGTRLSVLATILAVLALTVGSAALFTSAAIHAGPAGPQGPAGPAGPAGTNGTNGANGANGHNGTNGSNGSNGSNGHNGTNGTNGTTWLTLWYGFAPTFDYSGALTYISVAEKGCTDVGEGGNYCLFNVTNTCGPEDSLVAVRPDWACASWYFALVNVSFPVNATFYFTGSDPSLGYALGWGQSVDIQLWFQVVPYEEYASGTPPPTAPTLTPTIDLGFAQVTT